jgi:hypothetical protein
MPALDELTRGLGELAHGLRHAQLDLPAAAEMVPAAHADAEQKTDKEIRDDR